MGSIASPTGNGEDSQPRRVYFLTSPRTASNLFVRILNAPGQPNTSTPEMLGGYFYMPLMNHREEFGKWHVPFDQLTSEEQKSTIETAQKCTDTYREFLESSDKKGGLTFVKEHVMLLTKPSLERELIDGVPEGSTSEPWSVHFDPATDKHTASNPTLIPDNILTTFKPTFLIRHPALQLPSLLRAVKDTREPQGPESTEAYQRFWSNLRVFRRLHDFYTTQPASDDRQPMVIDASDFITHPATIMKHFCDTYGFDFDSCRFNWDVITNEQATKAGIPKVGLRMLSTLNASTGIQLDKANNNVDIDHEAVGWRKEFGEDEGRWLERAVRAALPDYEYLWARRVDPVLLEEKAMAVEDRGR